MLYYDKAGETSKGSVQLGGAKILLGKGDEMEFNLVNGNADIRTFHLRVGTEYMRREKE